MERRPGKQPAGGGGAGDGGGEVPHVRHGKGKVGIGIRSSSEYLQDTSEPRHVRSRGISASARRERFHHPAQDEDVDDDVVEEHMAEESDDHSGPYADYGPYSQRIEETTQTVQLRRRKDGRFAGSSGTSSGSTVSSSVGSKRSKTVDDSWVVKGEVEGGPVNGSVIPSFLGHIASRIWNGEERRSENGILKCQTRERVCKFLSEWAEGWGEGSDMRRRLRATGLSHVPGCMHQHIDWALITAFVERWQPDTNSFHLPFGEMTIMLHDVEAILRLPVEGRRATVDANVDQADYVADLLAVDRVTLYSPSVGVWDHGGVRIEAVLHNCLHQNAGRIEDTQLQAFLFLVLGCALFPDKSGNKLRPRDVVEASDPDTVSLWSWGSATLAYLYRQLGFSSRADAAGLTGCLTLMQAWIYEYFPGFRPHRDPHPIHDTQPRADAWTPQVQKKTRERLRLIRLALDRMSPLEVNWMPFGENPSDRVPRTLYTGLIQYREILEVYMPQRCLRQLGFVQVVPPQLFRPTKAVRSASSKDYTVQWPDNVVETWDMFPMTARLWIEQLSRPPPGIGAMCDQQYMDWFTRHSHPRLIRDVDDDDDGDDDLPPPTAPHAWMGRVTQGIHRLVAHRENMTTEDGVAAIDYLDRVMQDWHLATQRRH